MKLLMELMALYRKLYYSVGTKGKVQFHRFFFRVFIHKATLQPTLAHLLLNDMYMNTLYITLDIIY